MSIYINVVGQKLSPSAPIDVVVSGSSNFVKFKFNFDSGWESVGNKVVQFIQDGQGYDVPINENNIAFLPNNIIAGQCGMVIRGYSGSGDNAVIATSDILIFKILTDKYIDDPSSTSVTLKFYEEIMEAIESINTGSTIIKDGSITTPKIANGAVTSEKLDSSIITVPSGGTNGQILKKINGSVAWDNFSTSSDGISTVTVSDSGYITGDGTSEKPLDINTTKIATVDSLSSKIDNPSGGTDGQFLKKTSNGVAWDTPPTSSGSGTDIPGVDTSNNGKFLTISDGALSWVDLPKFELGEGVITNV